ncbi:hypothetical protein MJO28_016129 [Puccinia striiformis f. sp. tritici]|uniref:Uncharacterized protein n=1 Tax=Puccinia striiformis f. sp. tritici TaxID=168172 RepID=A0ACC0DSL5_9BASI|nr:hypothetical protein MJO28_016129 [Puccinia striiformis f. sp. tritici]
MSHTINTNQPHLSSLHPPTRGFASRTMPPPAATPRPILRVSPMVGNSTRPASRQTHEFQTVVPFVPPHLRRGPELFTPTSTLPPSHPDHQASINLGFEALTNSHLDADRPGELGPLTQRYDDHGNLDDFSLNPANFNVDQTQSTPVVDVVDHDTLQTMFHLPEAQLNQAQRILEMTPVNINAAILYSTFALRVAQDAIPRAVDGEATRPTIGPEMAADIGHFSYSEYIKNDIKDFVRRKILDGRVVSYSRRTNNEGAAEPNALLNLTLVHVARLPLLTRMQHLPHGYTQGNPHAQRSVLRLVREILKHDQVSLRNLLLKNIVNTSLYKVNGAAPGLEVLYNLINSHFFARPGVHLPLVDWEQIPVAVQVRFAYLRLETAAHAMRPTRGHGSQWTPIDVQLEFLAGQSMDYLRSWSDLIMAKDRELFGLAGSIYASVRHIAHLPTHEEVLEHEGHFMHDATDRNVIAE